MKNLQTIQKMSKVFKTLSMIAMIVSFLWAASSLSAMACFAVWGERGSIGQVILSAIQAETLHAAVCALLADAVFAVTDGVLFLFAWRYLQAEQADGTPFTHSGAVKIRNLGISTIVMPNVAVIVSAVIYSCFSMQLEPDWSTGASTLLGVALILASLIFHYGAELENGVAGSREPA